MTDDDKIAPAAFDAEERAKKIFSLLEENEKESAAAELAALIAPARLFRIPFAKPFIICAPAE